MAASRSISMAVKPLPTVAVAFGAAYGGGTLPAHLFTELGLAPFLALAQRTDVRADNGTLSLRDAVDAATPSRLHPPAPAPVGGQRRYDLESPAPLTVGRRLVHDRAFWRRVRHDDGYSFPVP